MNRVTRDVQANAYLIPGAIINKLLSACIISIISIGGYMIIWAINDAAYKAEVLNRLNDVEQLVQLHDTYRNQSDKSAAKVEQLDKRLDRHERKHKD